MTDKYELKGESETYYVNVTGRATDDFIFFFSTIYSGSYMYKNGSRVDV